MAQGRCKICGASFFESSPGARGIDLCDHHMETHGDAQRGDITPPKPWFPPPMADRPDGFECLVWHRGKWRHMRWASDLQGWERRCGGAYLPGDLGRLFAPLPWNTPEHEFYDGETS